ncbi:MAG: 2-oxoglutarate dehydrogenase complex dihydrolipoyllysine-residue succinyltransferase [Anaerolineae bacterium]|nr:2-oxoglutarate dehydrogenase complex dihydrolipoyllysine-residue succinyltransferase [Anaerolineae bacterium]MBL8104661.1 2-oxoglutarate dehydrogenase complex dihydrolipoyllysine-residue succinyltransferase [Anaerolineales bacterium]MCC7188860.1 2-oxoglutarate dehydrogenase complex dihydrolipoyllysine-residue succinyltransferase [Anaerolineales bacterium]
MSIEIIVPEMGESVIEATVRAWLKKEGDFVEAGEALVELETDKVNLEVGAKASGVLAKIQVAEGQDVKVGDVLGSINADAKQPASKPDPQPASPKPEPLPTPQEKPQTVQPQVTPVASRVAREQNVDVSKVRGTGPDGRVTKSDVQQYAQKQSSAGSEAAKQLSKPSQAAGVESAERREERERMSRRRRTIAQRLLEASQSTAMLTTFNEINMSAVMDLRRRRNEAFQARHGIKLGFTSFFTKASISALKSFPRLNAEIQGDEIVLKNYYDIGIAVGAEEGLVVPVLRDADRLTFAEIEKQVKVFSGKANDGSLSVEDLRGGTFTITNGGVFGSMLSTPILNLPQVGILGLHKIEERPIAENGQVVIRPMMYVALSYDHRIVDGREAVQFLVQVKELLEDPAWMLVEG